jgi:hypothetical protein
MALSTNQFQLLFMPTLQTMDGISSGLRALKGNAIKLSNI